MKSRVLGVLLGVVGCGGAGPGPAVASAPAVAVASTGLSSQQAAMALFKGNWASADVTIGELRAAEPFMPPPPPPVDPDYSGALAIEWKLSDAREGPGRWGGETRDISQRFALVVHTSPPQTVSFGRWHYTMCGINHSLSAMAESEDTGIAQLMCTGNGVGVSFRLVRRGRGETVDVHVHEGSDGLGGPTYRQGIAGQVQVPRRRAIHLKKSEQSYPEFVEEDWYFPFE